MKKLLLLVVVTFLSSCTVTNAAENTTYLYLAAGQYEREGDYEAAAENYRRILQTESSPTIYIKLAETYSLNDEKGLLDALDWLKKGYKAHPDSAELAFQIGAYYMTTADKQDNATREASNAEALDYFSKAAKLAATERNLAMLATAATAQKDYKLAEKTYKQLIEDFGRPEYYYSLGMLKLEAGDEAGGMDALMKAADAGLPQAYAQLAETALKNEDQDKALEYLLKMSEQRPDMGMIDAYIADIYRSREDYENAVRFYSMAAENTESTMSAALLKQVGSMAVDREDYATAYDAFKRAIDYSPDDTQSYYLAGYAAVLKGDRPLAQSIYDIGTARFPEYGYLLKISADNLIEMNRAKEALDKLKTVDELEHDIEYFYILSRAYAQADMAEESINALLAGLEEFPVSEDLYVLLAFTYDEQDRLSDCIALLKKGLGVLPDSAVMQNFLGYLYADHNMELREAELLIDAALAKEPDNYAYLDSKAWLLYRKGDLKAAHEYILQALELSPDKEDAELTGHRKEIERALGIDK